ncbi:MucBP domain-containing protein [Enterococcus faecalis]|uniref:MucBP domain-containing protein n=1 Tax=Enterococcus faecalis TaxID=1351 RepID=UPI00133054BB|nr:MucBP domain-containing protein [Enterococcus faecalis]MDT2059392.1 MucBP domain-containing protein [Enterococcus faecalis]
MKKSVTMISLGIFLCASSLQVLADANTRNASVKSEIIVATDSIDSWMPDRVLQNWVAKELGKDTSFITQDDMKNIIYLQDTPEGLTSLKGLEYATNLRNLYLGYSDIADLSPISSLTSIVNLQVNDTKVTDLSPIYALTGLKSLDISNLSIGDTNMTSLLQTCGSSLYQLVAMNTGLKNIDYFSPYTNLTSLELSYNEITDLRPLQNFTNTHGQAVGQTFPSTSVNSNSRNVTFDDLEIYYVDGTRLEPTDISDGGVFDSVTKKISFSNLSELSGTVSWSYYTAPVDPTTGIRFGGLVKNSYNLEIPAKVTAKYVDADGNKISDNVVKSGNVGETYTTEQKTVDGYTFKEVQGSATGTFTDQAQTVTYVYTKDPVAGGDVTAKYVDTDGNKISDNVVKSGNVGETYTTEQKTVDGYTFKEVQGSVTGTFTDQAQTVTYVYTKDPVAGGDVTAKYVNEDKSEKADTLPKTNEKKTTYFSIIGIAMVIVSFIVKLYFKSKKEH